MGGTRYQLAPLLWEDEVPAVVGFNPQEAVDYYMGRAADTDIYVGIFWRRIGSDVWIGDRHYESGSVYEFLDAYRSSRRTGMPQMLLFRCVAPAAEVAPTIGQDDTQFRKVAEFFEQSLVLDGAPVRHRAFVQEFADLDEFQRKLEVSLTAILSKRSRPTKERHADLFEAVRAFLSNFEELIGEERPSGPRLGRKYRVLDGASGETLDPPQLLETAPIELFLGKWSGRMLLLGAAGSGKTFEMLSMMWELLWQARENGNLRDFPVPVYFNLASWAVCYRAEEDEESMTFERWAERELVRRYSLSRQFARKLIGERAIIYCLDGVDELAVRHSEGDVPETTGESDEQSQRMKDACIRSLNRMLSRQTSARVIMCCQEKVYRDLRVKPALSNPLVLEPLSIEQVIGEMVRWRRLSALREAMEASAFLRAQCGNPLILRLACVAYAGNDNKDSDEDTRKRLQRITVEKIFTDLRDTGISAEDDGAVPDERLTAWQNRLVNHYVERCHPFESDEETGSATKGDSITTDDIKRYLPWFAARLDPDFLIEDFQPSLLSEAGYRRYRTTSALILTLLLCAVATVPCSIAIALEWILEADASLSVGIWQGLCIFGMTAPVVMILGPFAFQTTSWWMFGSLLGIAFSFSRGVVIACSWPEMYIHPADEAGPLSPTMLLEGLKHGAITLPCAVVVFSLFGRVAVRPLARYHRQIANSTRYEILPLENIQWSWIDRETGWGGWIGVFLGPCIGLAFVLAGFGFARGIALAIVAGVIVTLFTGFCGTALRISLRPNQGIERSLRHACVISLAVSVAAILACGICYGIGFGWRQAIVNALLACVVSVTWMMFGGIPVIRHVCLGFQLSRENATPSWRCLPPWRRTVCFLDEMVQLNLLRKSAGGYMFRHGVLRRYFLDLYGR